MSSSVTESALPSHHRALVLKDIKTGFNVEQVATPRPDLGSAIVRINVAGTISYQREVYNGDRQYAFPKPLVGGTSAIGHIAALGPDAVALQVGQLVYVDCVVHGRDNPDAIALLAFHEGSSDGSRRLMHNVWRDGVWAEYAKVPLENCISLDETRLCRDLGYTIDDLMYMTYLLVPYGGLRDIRLEPGETIVVCPATGGFGGAGVQVAIAMGARVIAMGRNERELKRLKEHVKRGSSTASIEVGKMTGDEEEDAAALRAFGTLDAVLDFSPPAASKSTHVRSAMMALRRGGRMSLMGLNENPIVPWTFIGNDITLKGKLMYGREDMLQFVKMLERGLFPRGRDFVDTKVFQMEDWKEGSDAAAKHTGIGRYVVFKPWN